MEAWVEAGKRQLAKKKDFGFVLTSEAVSWKMDIHQILSKINKLETSKTGISPSVPDFVPTYREDVLMPACCAPERTALLAAQRSLSPHNGDSLLPMQLGPVPIRFGNGRPLVLLPYSLDRLVKE